VPRPLPAPLSALALAALTVASGGAASGCGGADALTLSLDRDVADECGGACAAVEATAGGDPVDGACVALYADGERLPVDQSQTGPDGRVTLCFGGPLPLGEVAITAGLCDEDIASEAASLAVEPFGYDLGIERAQVTPDAAPFVPAPVDLDEPVVLSPTEGAWDSEGVLAPSMLRFGGRQLLYYAGTDGFEGYNIGVAYRDAEDLSSFVKYADNPILGPEPGTWRDGEQQTPAALEVDGEVWLYYSGAAVEGEPLQIGLATSADGLHFEVHPDNPIMGSEGEVGGFDGRAVAHPSVWRRGDGLFEMWYASGEPTIGYAVSEDGVDWLRYCDNPVFAGDGGWDRGFAKSQEVYFDGALYWMSYSGCEKECYEIGWAVSADGVRWVTPDEPVLPVGEGWNAQATQSGFLEVTGEGDERAWRFWYAGNDGLLQQIGVAEATGGP